MPLAMVLSPEKNRLIVLLNGWREQGIQVVDRASGRVLQTIQLPAVFLGVVFSPDGKSLYVSGGNQDAVSGRYRHLTRRAHALRGGKPRRFSRRCRSSHASRRTAARNRAVSVRSGRRRGRNCVRLGVEWVDGVGISRAYERDAQ
jgi:hypothetical protein